MEAMCSSCGDLAMPGSQRHEVSYGHYRSLTLPAGSGIQLAGGRFLRSYPYQEAYLLDRARQFRAALNLPLILLGGITSKQTMDLAMAEGFAFVALARALLREPDLILRMHTDPGVRSLCIHCNKCMPTIYRGTRCVLAETSHS